MTSALYNVAEQWWDETSNAEARNDVCREVGLPKSAAQLFFEKLTLGNQELVAGHLERHVLERREGS